jgi:serine/threonine protein kinase
MVSHSHLYCLQCGAANLLHAKFCVVCGHSLQLDASIPLPVVPAMPKAPSQSSSAQRALLKQRYRIVTQIGTGGFAEVYKAEDNQFGGRLVAIKAMGIEGMSMHEVSEATTAFEREALMLANLVHPNLPAIHDYFYENQHWYLVMSFIEGTTLEEYLRSRGGRLPVEKVLPIGIQLCTVLGYLHKQHPPIIFRDLKLTNVMRTPERQLYLIDFGVARLFKHGKARDTMALGSPGYAAPEQYGRSQTTPQTDIYSLGATLYALLSGIDPSEAPFRFAPLHIPVYPDLNTLIMSMVENDPQKRPPSMSVVKQELQRIALGHSSEWAQQNWQNNILHYVIDAKPQLFAADKRGLRPQNIQQKPPNSVQYQQYPAPQPIARSQQQLFYPPVTPAPAPFLSRRAMIIGGIGAGGLLTIGGLFAYLQAQFVGSAIVPVAIMQPTVQSIPAAPLQGQNPALNPGAFFAVAYSPDGRRIVAGAGSGQVHVLDSNGQLLNMYSGHTAPITGLSWSPDSRQVASASYDSTVQLWDPTMDKTQAIYRKDIGSVNALSWSPHGNYIASADYTHAVQVWSVNSLQTIAVYTNHRDLVRALTWSPNALFIASGSADYSVQVWGALNGTTRFNFQGHQGAVASVAWSPDSTWIASASDDRTVRVWDALAGNPVSMYAGHSAPVTGVVWSPDSHYIASASQDRTVHVWNPLDGRLLYVYSRHTNAVLSLDWSTSGSIVSTDADGNLRIWRPMFKN